MVEPDGGVGDEAPITLLADFVEEPPETLRPRVRASIQRRLLASDLADLSLMQILNVFLEFLKLTLEMLTGGYRKDGEAE